MLCWAGKIPETNEVMYSVNKRRCVLAVDDEPAILRIIHLSLRVLGYDVITCAGGEEALNLVETRKPDVMLLDVLMPGMDGFETLEKLRIFSDLPVIVFSAHSSSREKAMSLGADDFITKPFTPGDMANAIQEVLRSRVKRLNSEQPD
jgi:DNA-binding response OmpR family regulator